MRGRVGPRSAHTQPLLTPTTVINGGDEDNLYNPIFSHLLKGQIVEEKLYVGLENAFNIAQKNFYYGANFLF